MKQPSEEEIRGWDKLMGEPILPEPSEELSRIRLRLLTFGSIALAIGLFDLKIDPTSTVLGLKISNLTDSVVRVVVIAVLSYLLVHFVWAAADAWSEWILRLTGYERTYYQGGAWGGGKLTTGGPDRDPIKTPRQATLYSWWKNEAGKIGDLEFAVSETRKKIEDLHPGYPADKLNEVKVALDKLSDSVRAVPQVLMSVQMHAALRRFDNKFRFFAVSQLYRWFIFDLALPILVGASGVVAVSRSWWSPLL